MASIEQLRLLLNDPSGSFEILSGVDYNSILNIESNVYRAAALGARTIAAKYAKKVSTTVGPIKMENEGKFNHYMSLAKTYDKRAASSSGSVGGFVSGGPSLTGTSLSDMETQRDDTDRYDGKFYRGITDNPQDSGYE